jgi:hypothetical protein
LAVRLAVVVAAVALVPVHGSAQTSTPSRPAEDLVIHTQVDPPNKMRIDFGALIDGGVDGLTPNGDTTIRLTPRDRLWEFRASRSFEFGKGLVASAHLVGRRGYRLPLYLSEPVGADRSTFDLANFLTADMSQFEIDWVAKMRVEKVLVQRKWSMRLVGEALVPLNHSERTGAPQPTSLLNSRAIKVGLVLGF